MRASFVPDRGYVMTQGQVPFVVVSAKDFNDRVGVAICWPVSGDGRQESNPFAVKIGNKRHGFGYVMCHQPRTILWRTEEVTRHPWLRMDPKGFTAALFKLNEVINSE